MLVDQLRDLVCDVLREANGQKCVVDKGLTIDDVCDISKDDMNKIEEEFGITFVGIGNILLIKLYLS